MSPLRRGLLLWTVLLLAPACAHAPAAPPSRPPPPPAPPPWTVRRLPAMEVVYAPVGTPALLGRRLHQVLARARALGWRFTGPPMLVIPKTGARALAVPVAGHPPVAAPFRLRALAPTRAAVRTVRGTLPEAEGQARRMRRALRARGLTPAGTVVLVLMDDPATTEPSARRTRLVVPLR